MSIEAINNLSFSAEISSVEFDPKPTVPFENFLVDNLMQTNEKLNTAEAGLKDLALGRANNLHQTMLTLEEAKLSLQMMEQVRNRVMGAWQELLREQI